MEEISNQTLINLISEQTEHLVELKKLNKDDYLLDKFIESLRSELIYRLQTQRPINADFVGGKL